jgi:hypothetical protein
VDVVVEELYRLQMLEGPSKSVCVATRAVRQRSLGVTRCQYFWTLGSDARRLGGLFTLGSEAGVGMTLWGRGVGSGTVGGVGDGDCTSGGWMDNCTLGG